MKILYVITKADEIGGAQTHVRDLASKFQDDGNEVIVIVGENGIFTEQLKEKKIKFIIVDKLQRNISPLKDILCALKLRKIIKKISPDIVTLHSSKAGILGRLALIFTSIPVIFTAHGWAFTDGISWKKKYFYILIEKIFTYLTDHIIVVSNNDKELAIKYKVVPASKQIVIHNGIPDILDSSLLEEKQKESKNISPISLISIARFSKQKDHKTLLYALKEISDKNWHLKLVGKGPLLEEVKLLSKELNINDKIEFCGERDDIEFLLSKSDIFILSTNWEGLPISIIEAMRASLPIVATNVGGIKELIIDNENGYLIERNSSHQLSNKIASLIISKEKRLSFGKKSREIFLKEFHIYQMYKKTKYLYEKTIIGKNK